MIKPTLSELFAEKSIHLRRLGLTEPQIERLQTYFKHVWEKNQSLNLFSRKMSLEEWIDNHLIDCLIAYPHLPTKLAKMADFGSGGGMPGVIYALLRPETEVHLFEKSPKKQAFLKECRAYAPNLVIHGEIPSDFEGFDLIIARAFKPIDVTITLSAQYFKDGGRYFLLKGRLAKIEEEIALAKQKWGEFEAETLPLTSPVLEVERHLVLIHPLR